jgi:FKBP-type peptidyl-prolyl cis-trans isomerase (trigger factor)
LVFSAEFEIFPEVKSTDLTGSTVIKPVCEINEDDINNTIEKIREQRVAWKDKEGAAEEGDKITMDFNGKLDGEPFEGGSAEKFDLVLGKGGFIADFEKA